MNAARVSAAVDQMDNSRGMGRLAGLFFWPIIDRNTQGYGLWTDELGQERLIQKNYFKFRAEGCRHFKLD